VDVRNIGVTVTKKSPDLMMVVHIYSPDQSRDALFISNYATLSVTDILTRIDGVGSITVFGSRDYGMRIWVDPDRLQTVGLTATDVLLALQGQHGQAPPGVLRHPRRAGPERPGCLRGARAAAGAEAGRISDRGADARTPRQSRRILQHRRQTDPQRGGPAAGRGPHRARGAGLFCEFVSRPRSGSGARHLPAPRLERAGDGERHH